MVQLRWQTTLSLFVLVVAVVAFSILVHKENTRRSRDLQGSEPESPPEAPDAPEVDKSQQFASQTQRFFVDTPQPGARAEAFWVPVIEGGLGRLTRLVLRVEKPFTTDSAELQLFRYRAPEAGASTTDKSELTSVIALDSSLPWSKWNNLTDEINTDLTLDPSTDTVVIVLTYTTGENGEQSVRAVNVTFAIDKVDD